MATQGSKDESALVAIFERTGATALVVAGAVEFLPALFLLVAHRDQVPAAIWFTWIIPALVYGCGFVRRWRRNSAILQSIAGLLLISVAIVVPQAYGPGWLPLPFSAFAVAFGAAFTLEVIPALIVILLAAGLNYAAVLWPTRQMILSAADLAGGSIGPVFILIAAPALLGMAYSWRRAARLADANTAEVESAAAAAYRAVQVQSARTSVDRRIHETVLNTLNAIAQGGSGRGDLLVAECRRDVEQLGLGALPVQEATVGALIDEARIAAGLVTPQLLVQLEAEFLLPPQSASALRDALVETLRNVERHAQATEVEISATQGAEMLVVEVRDNGHGFAAGDTERFGMRNTIKASLAALGGEAVVDSSPEHGTAVRLRVPIVVAAELQVPISPISEILLDSVWPRILLFAPAIFGLVMLPWIAGGLGSTAVPYAASFLVFFSCNLALALLWRTPWRVPLTLLTILAGLVSYAVACINLDSCSAASSVHWIINSVAGGIGLLLFAVQRYWWHWMILPAFTGVGLYLALCLPDDCRAIPVMSLVVTVVYMSAALFLMTVLFREFDARRRDALVLWASSVEYQAEIERQIAVTTQWSRVSASTTALLKGIAAGELSAEDPLVRERAASEEGQLRGNLGIERLSSSFMWRAVLDIVEVAAQRGLSVDAAAISTPASSRPVPEVVTELLGEIVLGSPSRSVTIRMLVDDGQPEVIVTAPSDTIESAWAKASSAWGASGLGDADALAVPGFVLSRTAISDRQAILSIRRHEKEGT